MEWDKFWSQNKMFLEHKASRFMGICKDTAVPVLVSNFATPGITEVTETQVHPSRPELGTRVMRRSERLLIEQDDCSLFKVTYHQNHHQNHHPTITFTTSFHSSLIGTPPPPPVRFY